jgi:hypothetical protein
MPQIMCKVIPRSVVGEDEEKEGTTNAILRNTGNPDDPIIVFNGCN